MGKKKYFGTDGIRNRVGQGLMKPDEVLKLGWAAGQVLKAQGATSVLIGKDTRISGYMFESALEAGFIAAGIRVYLVGPMPTPAISYLTQTFNCDLGVVISASHNPHHDNGIKFFNADGKKVSDAFEHQIESALDDELGVVESEQLGKAYRIDDAPGRYIEFCKGTYRAKRKLNGMKIVLDCANGATYHIAPNVFRELGADIEVIAASPDGVNINECCGATDLAQLKQSVLAHDADIGIAFDGDGDRVMMVDAQGQVADGDALLYILATMTGKPIAGVVGTVMTNMGVEQNFLAKGVEFVRTAVGDRFVMEALVEKGWNYGAEQSGHVLCLNKIGTGDGIVAALQVLAALISHNKTLSQVLAELTPYPQVMHNVTVAEKRAVESSPVLLDAIAQAESALAGEGRVLIRPSGTEPKIRVMVEGKSLELVEELVQMLENTVKAEFS